MQDPEPSPLSPKRPSPKNPRPQPPFYDDLGATLAEAWRLLKRGVADRRSGFHTPALATLGSDGAPSVRTVVLRAADPATRTLRFHTDIRSAKFEEIGAEPRVAMHFYDAGKKIQLRVSGLASRHRSDRLAGLAWDATRPFSRLCYQAELAPGEVVVRPPVSRMDANAEVTALARDNFAAVSVAIREIEWLYLAAQGHRRARFAWQADQLQADWLAP